MVQIKILVFTVIVSLCTTGCATILKGYEDSVLLVRARDSIRVVTNEGIEIPVTSVKISSSQSYRDSEGNKQSFTIEEIERRIQLRSNKVHTLILKYHNKEKTVTVYPKIGAGWAVLDILFAGIPTFYDAYTGNWCYFSDIDATF